ncbi:hypothetical protein F2Q70_00028055 [Brassica cretica]|uniref:Uncharacterized protein n=1 Tax=Brassica cretica TaxID=69181 RepID=A0A8S9L528_BRACR|nr:hypothetical protein F2Q70_00028055 [Brassica cretica]
MDSTTFPCLDECGIRCECQSIEFIIVRRFFNSGHDETRSLLKVEEEGNNNNLFLEILKSGEDITLQHPWIQRWCKKKDVSTDHGSFEPENQKEMEKKQYLSIAAMALMGKALSGLNPHGLRNTDSLMVWNARY